MTTAHDPKATLKRYLQGTREGLLWKLDGLSERDLRLPRTPTGTNLLGIVKHVAGVEIDYFGVTFGRDWPTPQEVPWIAAPTGDVPPDLLQADFFATADEPAEQILDLYRRVWAFADETIDALPLDAPGRVPWWGDGGADVTLHTILVHVLADLKQHAGHADILRETIDGKVGLLPGNDNMPGGLDWPAYTARLTAIADRF
ncbi:DinB family protein [Isoptericola sp. NEAU-Y5]|uniref:DinB family protein n=1 Tax=Isoptericola luteus TaxID=2879484 RepID=A0ABS7ZHE3_9MICO|nr:DinB family protein [Isoptericola sp. NEAU-Y5]MCA5894446.1 DinB family protein [Isoptericola sp. NEAU-Y5]